MSFVNDVYQPWLLTLLPGNECYYIDHGQIYLDRVNEVDDVTIWIDGIEFHRSTGYAKVCDGNESPDSDSQIPKILFPNDTIATKTHPKHVERRNNAIRAEYLVLHGYLESTSDHFVETVYRDLSLEANEQAKDDSIESKRDCTEEIILSGFLPNMSANFVGFVLDTLINAKEKYESEVIRQEPIDWDQGFDSDERS